MTYQHELFAPAPLVPGLTLVEPVTSFVSSVLPRMPLLVYPLIGAVIGYIIKR